MKRYHIRPGSIADRCRSGLAAGLLLLAFFTIASICTALTGTF